MWAYLSSDKALHTVTLDIAADLRTSIHPLWMDYETQLLTQFVTEALEDPVVGPGVRDCAYKDSKAELLF